MVAFGSPPGGATDPHVSGTLRTAPAHHCGVCLRLIRHRARSVAHLFEDRVAKTPSVEAFRFPAGQGWESVTWAQVDARVRPIAAGLVALGIQSQDRVAIASSTRYEWVVADLAVMLAGAATTAIYPTRWSRS